MRGTTILHHGEAGLGKHTVAIDTIIQQQYTTEEDTSSDDNNNNNNTKSNSPPTGKKEGKRKDRLHCIYVAVGKSQVQMENIKARLEKGGMRII